MGTKKSANIIVPIFNTNVQEYIHKSVSDFWYFMMLTMLYFLLVPNWVL